jgi:hypothetical protein
VCNLTVTCTCLLKVSEVDKWVLMSLISGLNDDDIKQAVLSKVEDTPLLLWRPGRLAETQ